ncbi:MAG: hypothetical protein AVDCRST_MAG95-4007, partial [uncultured Adhaeribacter sp.]
AANSVYILKSSASDLVANATAVSSKETFLAQFINQICYSAKVRITIRKSSASSINIPDRPAQNLFCAELPFVQIILPAIKPGRLFFVPKRPLSVK